MDMMPTPITGVGTAGRNAMMFSNLFASLAENAVRVEMILEPFEAGIIIRETPVEVMYGEPFHCYYSLPSRDIVTHRLPTVKG